MAQTIVFTDKSFNAKNIANYHLSLQVFLKGLSFCILDKEKNKFIALGHYYYEHIVSYDKILEVIDDIFKENEILKLPFPHIKLIFITEKFTFVPSAFYQPQTEKDFFEFNHNLENYDELFNNYIFSNSNYVLFSIPNFVKKWVTDNLPTAKIYHQSVPFIEEIMLNTKNLPNSNNVYVNMHYSFFDIAVVQNSELKLFNCFEINSDTDFKYFLLNVYDTLKLSPTEISIIFSGFVNKNDDKVEQTKLFIKNVEFFKKPQYFEYSFDFNSVEEHFFINMLNLYQCG